MSSSEYLTVKEAAEHLNISVRTIYGLIHSKSIPFIRLGRIYRFSVTALNAWMSEQTTPAQTPAVKEETPQYTRRRTATRGTAGSRASTAQQYPPPVRPGYVPIQPVPFDL